MATSEGTSSGATYVPPMEPMLLTVKVPAARSAGVSFPVVARRCRHLRSVAMAAMERLETFLMVGTRRPWGVSIATPMLWIARRVRWGWEEEEEGVGMSTRALRRGKSVRASETALIMKGREESVSAGVGAWGFSRWRRAVSGVRSISSA